MSRKTTLEQLAQMVQRGFEQTSTKEDLKRVREDVRTLRVDMENRFEGVDRRLDAIEMEVKEVRTVLGPLARTVAEMEFDLQDLRSRVERLEKKAGLHK